MDGNEYIFGYSESAGFMNALFCCCIGYFPITADVILLRTLGMHNLFLFINSDLTELHSFKAHHNIY